MMAWSKLSSAFMWSLAARASYPAFIVSWSSLSAPGMDVVLVLSFQRSAAFMTSLSRSNLRNRAANFVPSAMPTSLASANLTASWVIIDDVKTRPLEAFDLLIRDNRLSISGFDIASSFREKNTMYLLLSGRW